MKQFKNGSDIVDKQAYYKCRWGCQHSRRSTHSRWLARPNTREISNKDTYAQTLAQTEMNDTVCKMFLFASRQTEVIE